MDCTAAIAEKLLRLDVGIESAEIEFRGQIKNPTNALRKFRNRLASCTVPILFRNMAAEVQHSIRGVMQHHSGSEQFQTLLRECASLLQRIESELKIDFAVQMELASMTAEEESQPAVDRISLDDTGSLECTILDFDSIPAQTARAVIRSLTDNGFLDGSRFDPIQQLDLQSYQSREAWQASCEEVLSQVPIDPNADVVAWIECEIVITKWSQILSNTSYLFGFEDAYIFPTDAAWLLFFFHHDVLEYGIRKA